jgi:Mrp family chromosome partitioning ATPase
VEEDPHSLLARGHPQRAHGDDLRPAGRDAAWLVRHLGQRRRGQVGVRQQPGLSLAGAGKKTLLDRRRHAPSPAQHRSTPSTTAVGLAGLLTTRAAAEEGPRASVAHGLDLLTAGDPAGKAAELCEGAVLLELVRSLRESYECIVVDSPAVLESSEARVLASLSDAVVFVVRLDASRRPAVKRAAGILRGVNARLLGCIVNGAGSRRGARAYAGGISFETPSAGGTGGGGARPTSFPGRLPDPPRARRPPARSPRHAARTSSAWRRSRRAPDPRRGPGGATASHASPTPTGSRPAAAARRRRRRDRVARKRVARASTWTVTSMVG